SVAAPEPVAEAEPAPALEPEPEPAPEPVALEPEPEAPAQPRPQLQPQLQPAPQPQRQPEAAAVPREPPLVVTPAATNPWRERALAGGVLVVIVALLGAGAFAFADRSKPTARQPASDN